LAMGARSGRSRTGNLPGRDPSEEKKNVDAPLVLERIER
jgi:hypothetical protein